MYANLLHEYSDINKLGRGSQKVIIFWHGRIKKMGGIRNKITLDMSM